MGSGSAFVIMLRGCVVGTGFGSLGAVEDAWFSSRALGSEPTLMSWLLLCRSSVGIVMVASEEGRREMHVDVGFQVGNALV